MFYNYKTVSCKFKKNETKVKINIVGKMFFVFYNSDF